MRLCFAASEYVISPSGGPPDGPRVHNRRYACKPPSDMSFSVLDVVIMYV